MSRITIAVYRPKKGKEADLLKLIHDHMPILEGQGLITSRKPVVMRAADKTIVEIFEWKSSEAIEAAHSNKEVLKLWDKFNEVCDYEIPVNIEEFHNMFSEFEPVN